MAEYYGPDSLLTIVDRMLERGYQKEEKKEERAFKTLTLMLGIEQSMLENKINRKNREYNRVFDDYSSKVREYEALSGESFDINSVKSSGNFQAVVDNINSPMLSSYQDELISISEDTNQYTDALRVLNKRLGAITDVQEFYAGTGVDYKAGEPTRYDVEDFSVEALTKFLPKDINVDAEFLSDAIEQGEATLPRNLIALNQILSDQELTDLNLQIRRAQAQNIPGASDIKIDKLKTTYSNLNFSLNTMLDRSAVSANSGILSEVITNNLIVQGYIDNEDLGEEYNISVTNLENSLFDLGALFTGETNASNATTKSKNEDLARELIEANLKYNSQGSLSGATRDNTDWINVLEKVYWYATNWQNKVATNQIDVTDPAYTNAVRAIEQITGTNMEEFVGDYSNESGRWWTIDAASLQTMEIGEKIATLEIKGSVIDDQNQNIEDIEIIIQDADDSPDLPIDEIPDTGFDTSDLTPVRLDLYVSDFAKDEDKSYYYNMKDSGIYDGSGNLIETITDTDDKMYFDALSSSTTVSQSNAINTLRTSSTMLDDELMPFIDKFGNLNGELIYDILDISPAALFDSGSMGFDQSDKDFSFNTNGINFHFSLTGGKNLVKNSIYGQGTPLSLSWMGNPYRTGITYSGDKMIFNTSTAYRPVASWMHDHVYGTKDNEWDDGYINDNLGSQSMRVSDGVEIFQTSPYVDLITPGNAFGGVIPSGGGLPGKMAFGGEASSSYTQSTDLNNAVIAVNNGYSPYFGVYTYGMVNAFEQLTNEADPRGSNSAYYKAYSPLYVSRYKFYSKAWESQNPAAPDGDYVYWFANSHNVQPGGSKQYDKDDNYYRKLARGAQIAFITDLLHIGPTGGGPDGIDKYDPPGDTSQKDLYYDLLKLIRDFRGASDGFEFGNDYLLYPDLAPSGYLPEDPIDLGDASVGDVSLPQVLDEGVETDLSSILEEGFDITEDIEISRQGERWSGYDREIMHNVTLSDKATQILDENFGINTDSTLFNTEASISSTSSSTLDLPEIHAAVNIELEGETIGDHIEQIVDEYDLAGRHIYYSFEGYGNVEDGEGITTYGLPDPLSIAAQIYKAKFSKSDVIKFGNMDMSFSDVEGMILSRLHEFKMLENPELESNHMEIKDIFNLIFTGDPKTDNRIDDINWRTTALGLSGYRIDFLYKNQSNLADDVTVFEKEWNKITSDPRKMYEILSNLSKMVEDYRTDGLKVTPYIMYLWGVFE